MFQCKKAHFVLLLIILNSICFTDYTYASRKLFLPDVKLFTMHGGTVCDDPAGSTDPAVCKAVRSCVSADMNNLEPIGTVLLAWHLHQFEFRNISSIDQSVTISIENTSKLSGGLNSVGSSINDSPIAAKTITTTASFVIPANGSWSASFRSYCTSAGVCNLASATDDLEAICLASNPTDKKVCIAINSTYGFNIEINEDRGAILASLTTGAHRCSGYKDHYITSPSTIAINGGRPF